MSQATQPFTVVSPSGSAASPTAVPRQLGGSAHERFGPGRALAERFSSLAAGQVLQAAALVGILLLALGLSVVGLDRQGYGNTYYAAAVKSMLTSWHNFFFVSFDPAGFVAVDKPPVGLWLQAASARAFGFNGLSLFLPQVLSGLAAVALLGHLVRRAFGPAAGLLAALTLTVTPINVITNRNNTMDSQLVLVLLLATWAVSLAAERGQLRWLLASAALVGLGYNIKMLQAYPVVPAFGLAYLLWAPLRRRARIGHLTLAGLVLLVVSLSWSAVVDLTPPEQRPYVGSSGSNSALSLALGYNGLGRLTMVLAEQFPALQVGDLTVDLAVVPAFAPGIGSPGLLRLFSDSLAGQASWLLPLALIGLFATASLLLRRKTGPASEQPLTNRQRIALVIWGGWLLTWTTYFSVARFYHFYYLVMLGPAVAALVGIGATALWRAYRRGGWRSWGLPLSLLGTAAVQAGLLAAYPGYQGWLTPLILVPVLVAVLLLAIRCRAANPRPALGAASAGVLALLVAPTVWAAVSVGDGSGGAWLPEAGPPRQSGFGPGGRPGGFGPVGQSGGGFGPGSQPGASFGQRGQLGGGFGQSGRAGGGIGQGGQSVGGLGPPGRADGGSGQAARAAGGGFGGRTPSGGVRPAVVLGGPAPVGGRGGGGGALTFAGQQWNSLDPTLVSYLLANQGAARFLVATPSSSYASLFMLATNQPAMALGGYQGWDPILTVDALADRVAAGTVRFFLLNPASGPPRNDSAQDATGDLAAWVRSSCAAVPVSEWQAPSAPAGFSGRGAGPGGQSQQLYDCAQPAAAG